MKLDEVTLDVWAHSLIKANQMTKKEYYNMSMIMLQSLKYAVQREMIEKRPFDAIKIDRKMFRVVKKKPDETQVYLIEDQDRLKQKPTETLKIVFKQHLAIPLAFQTGN